MALSWEVYLDLFECKLLNHAKKYNMERMLKISMQTKNIHCVS